MVKLVVMLATTQTRDDRLLTSLPLALAAAGRVLLGPHSLYLQLV